jgi:hypothetical protein
MRASHIRGAAGQPLDLVGDEGLASAATGAVLFGQCDAPLGSSVPLVPNVACLFINPAATASRAVGPYERHLFYREMPYEIRELADASRDAASPTVPRR